MMIKQIHSTRDKNKGFSLLEVLITLVILAIGLLGLAGLQATGLKQNHSAYIRSQVTQLAYDIADRMRANMTAVDSYLTTDPASATVQVACTTTTGCPPDLMAKNDLYEWNLALTSVLPPSPFHEATISIATGIYTISITWDDNRDGEINGNDPNFLVSFGL